MLDIVKMSEELRSKLQLEADTLINDRLTMRDVLEARSRELADKRDAEIGRIESWAADQRKLVQEIFTALIQETEMDRMKNEESLERMTGGMPAPEDPRPYSGENHAEILKGLKAHELRAALPLASARPHFFKATAPPCAAVKPIINC